MSVSHKMVMCCKFMYTVLFIVTTSFVKVTIYGTVSEKMIHRYIYIKVIKMIHVRIAITLER